MPRNWHRSTCKDDILTPVINLSSGRFRPASVEGTISDNLRYLDYTTNIVNVNFMQNSLDSFVEYLWNKMSGTILSKH